MSIFERKYKERKGQPLYWLYVLVSLLCTAGLVTGFAFSDRIAGLMPQSTWFVVVFVILAVFFVAVVGRFIKRL